MIRSGDLATFTPKAFKEFVGAFIEVQVVEMLEEGLVRVEVLSDSWDEKGYPSQLVLRLDLLEAPVG